MTGADVIPVLILAIVTLGVTGVIRSADAFAALAGLFALDAAYLTVWEHTPLAILDASFAGLNAWLWWHYRNDDDDDHRGKRLKAWARSKLPKPAARTVKSPV